MNQKRQSFLCAATALMILLMFFSPRLTQVLAEEIIHEETIELTSSFNGQFTLDSSDSQLFSLENIAPGAKWHGKLSVVNNGSSQMDISIISITSNLRDTSLYDALDLQISTNNKVLYKGGYGAAAFPITEKESIGPGKTLTYDIMVTLPNTVGNEVMGKKMNSSWTFEANYYGKDLFPIFMRTYKVKYVNENGVDLLPSKIGKARMGTEITEKAKAIKGYTSNKQEQTITIQGSPEKNIITFVYSKDRNGGPFVEPDLPVGNDSSADLENSEENVKTGVDMAKNNTDQQVWLVILVLSFFTLVVFYGRLQAESKRVTKKKIDQNDMYETGNSHDNQ